MTWEPDLLDRCPCGGPRSYAECCRPEVDTFDAVRAGEQFGKAMAAGEFLLAETLARVPLAKYVRWVRQHTAPAMHMGKAFYDRMVEVDALALESLVEIMIRTLHAAGKDGEVYPQLQRLQELVGVPRLATRIVAISARWLLAAGRREDAVLELDKIGDPEYVSDSLALAILAKTYDPTEDDRERLLTMSVNVASCDEDRYRARLDLASHLAGVGKRDEAMALVRSALESAPADAGGMSRSEAVVLCWKISGSEEDFPEALAEMTRIKDAGARLRYGILLIDCAKYSEAENLLMPLVSEGNIPSILLLTDIHLRTEERASAFQVFSTIQEGCVPPDLQYAYAHTMALIVLAGFRELKGRAESLLKAVSPDSEELHKQVVSMLAALDRL